MPRLKEINPDTVTGKAKEIFDGPLAQKRLNIFKGIANNPGVLGAFLGFAGGVKAGSLTPGEHELVALTVGQRNGCEYCVSVHTKIASGAGVNEAAALNARKGKADDERHQALLTFTNAVLDKNGFVTDDELNAFRAAGYDDAAVVEVIGAIAVNTFTNYFNHVNATVLDEAFQTAPQV